MWPHYFTSLYEHNPNAFNTLTVYSLPFLSKNGTKHKKHNHMSKLVYVCVFLSVRPIAGGIVSVEYGVKDILLFY